MCMCISLQMKVDNNNRNSNSKKKPTPFNFPCGNSDTVSPGQIFHRNKKAIFQYPFSSGTYVPGCVFNAFPFFLQGAFLKSCCSLPRVSGMLKICEICDAAQLPIQPQQQQYTKKRSTAKELSNTSTVSDSILSTVDDASLPRGLSGFPNPFILSQTIENRRTTKQSLLQTRAKRTQ